jgi:PAS domain S-box-containing protein
MVILTLKKSKIRLNQWSLFSNYANKPHYLLEIIFTHNGCERNYPSDPMSFEPIFDKFPLQKKSILIVEDDEVLAMHMADNLSKAGYEVYKPVSTAINVVEKIKADPPTLILMDIELGKQRNEIEAIEEISRTSDIPIIFIAGILEENIQNNAKIAASYGYLVKPVLERELTETIERAFYKHKIEQQIKVSEKRYRTLIEQASDGIFLINLDYKIVDVNEAGYQLLGYSKEELVNKSLKELIYFDDPNERILSINEIQNQTIQIEYKIIHKGGSLVDVEIRGKLLEEGIFQAIVRDITERKKLQERYQLLFEEMVEAFALHEIVLDENGKPIDYIFLDVNPAFERLTGLKKEDIINKRILEVLPKTESYWIETYGNVALTEEDITFEDYAIELDRWYTVVAFSPKKGQVATIFMDITDRKKAEDTLHESEKLFRKMFSEHHVPMLLIDPIDNSIVDANSGAATYYGYSVEKLCNMKIGDINTLSTEEMYEIIDRENQEKNKYLVFPNRLANGEIRMVEIYTTPIVINKKTVIYSIIHDITERIEAETKFKNQLDELQRWHNVTLGREERIIELKREVNQLLKSNGESTKYNSVEEN